MTKIILYMCCSLHIYYCILKRLSWPNHWVFVVYQIFAHPTWTQIRNSQCFLIIKHNWLRGPSLASIIKSWATFSVTSKYCLSIFFNKLSTIVSCFNKLSLMNIKWSKLPNLNFAMSVCKIRPLACFDMPEVNTCFSISNHADCSFDLWGAPIK